MEKSLALKDVMRSPEVLSRFSDVLGNNIAAGSYISQVLIAVANNESLSRCDVDSIANCALRAATMRLSVDVSTGHAYLIPFRGACTLVVGYKGLKHMALRTGKYRDINVATIYAGQTVEEDQMTGHHTITGPYDRSKEPIGYMLFFELISGYRKTFYMTVNECMAHARKFSKNFSNPDSVWAKNPSAMCKKTVVRLGLSQYGYLDPLDTAMLGQEEEDGDYIDIDAVTVVEQDPITAEQAMSDLGFCEPKTKQDRTAEMIQAGIQMTASREKPNVVMTDGKAGAMVGLLEGLFSDNQETNRHALTRYIFGAESTKDLTHAQKIALWRWMEPAQVGDVWTASDKARKEAAIIISAAKQAE